MSGSGTVAKRQRLPRVAWLLVPLLGLFFLVYPIQVLLAEDPTPARLVFALVGAALFAGVFLWLMWLHEPLQLLPAGPSEVLKYRATIACLLVLAGTLSLVLGAEWRMLFFYHSNVAAGIMLTRRDAYVVIAGISLLTFVLGFPLGMAWLAFPAAAIGLWSTAFVGQAAAVAQLRAAREDLARLAVAEERLRFARDLHDLLGQSLSSIALKSELARRLLPTAPDRATAELTDIEHLARRSLREVREAVAGYRQPTLTEELDGAREVLDAAGIDCRIENATGPLPKQVEAVLAWTVREGVTNVIRHSRARRCDLRLAERDGTARAEVTDDGRGHLPARDGPGGPDAEGSASGGSGLSGLAERVSGLGGEFEARSLPGGGFGLRVGLPLRGGAPPRREPAAGGVRAAGWDGRR